ncbi:MAG: 30S ribosomal protein S6 [Clostridiales bacterium]|nr:30S ribosomal protein S6 [Clostridiales bacterium]
MSALTNNYETMMVFTMTKGEEYAAELLERFKSLIEENGTLESIDEWGKRKLAYLINDETDGYYVLINFSSNHEFPAELDRVVNITDGVLRSLTIKKDEGEVKDA